MDQLNWIKDLDQSGWVAAALFVMFFIITALTIAMMLKLNKENKKEQKKKSLKKSQVVPSNTTRTVPIKPAVKNAEKKKDDSSPLEEAEVYIAYGLNKQAINLLEKYLKEHPSNKTALEMLKKARSNARE